MVWAVLLVRCFDFRASPCGLPTSVSESILGPMQRHQDGFNHPNKYSARNYQRLTGGYGKSTAQGKRQTQTRQQDERLPNGRGLVAERHAERSAWVQTAPYLA